MNFKVKVDPILWFVCKLCREVFQDVETLKQHKFERHFENWEKVQCIIFEETLYEEPWSPSQDNICPNFENKSKLLLDQDVGCKCGCVCRLGNISSSSTSLKNNNEDQIVRADQNQSGKLNPFVLINRLTCQELNNCLKGNFSNFSEDATCSRNQRKRKPPSNLSIHLRKFLAAKKRTKTQYSERKNISEAISEERLEFNEESSNLGSEFEQDPLYIETEDDLKDCPMVDEVALEIIETGAGHSKPLIEWLALQKETQLFNGEAKNVILIDPDPTLTPDNPFEVNSYNPVTCKLCQTKLTTDDGLRNHLENCWLHNKPHHRHCVPCDLSFINRPATLNHIRSYHIKNEGKTDNDEGRGLEMIDWLKKEKENPKNVFLLEPDITLPVNSSYLVSQSCAVKCVICRAQLTSDSLLKTHVRTCWRYNISKHVHCVPCHKTFASHKALLKHEKCSGDHANVLKAMLKCGVCDMKFSNKSELNYHVQSFKAFALSKRLQKIESGKTKCNGESFGVDDDPDEDTVSNNVLNTEAALYDWLQLQRELRNSDGGENLILLDPEPRPGQMDQVTQDNYFTCRLCSKKLISVRKVKMHVNCYVQNRKRHVYCVPCEMGFESPKELQDHKNVEHFEEHTATFKCTFCSKEFIDEKAFENHEQAHLDSNFKAFFCPRCPSRFKTKKSLNKHMIVHGIQTEFVCSFCSQYFNSKLLLDVHERSHTGERPFVCTVENCDSAFSSRAALKGHEVQFHVTELGLAEHLCPTCGRTFGARSLLNRHVKHCGERAYKCTHEGCTKAFSINSKLVEHMRTHTGETPFQCDECGTAFALSGSFVKHKQTHEGTRNKAQCHLCPKTFLGSWELKRHLNKFHAVFESGL